MAGILQDPLKLTEMLSSLLYKSVKTSVCNVSFYGSFLASALATGPSQKYFVTVHLL